MGNDKGSLLWEKKAAVLRGTTNLPGDLDSVRLPPWMGTFVWQFLCRVALSSQER